MKQETILQGESKKEIVLESLNDSTWSKLFERQIQLIKKEPCKEWLVGLRKIGFNPKKLPHKDEISKKIKELTGWKLVSAENKYLTDKEWFEHFRHNRFPVTDFIRKPEELDFTPLPDMFHDFFGHLPFMTNKKFTDLVELFGKAFKLAPKNKKHWIARLWWHSIEFGLIKENNEIKILGAGLISSHKEFLHSLRAPHRPFVLRDVVRTPKATHDIHPQFFVLESWEQLKSMLEDLIQRWKIGQ